MLFRSDLKDYKFSSDYKVDLQYTVKQLVPHLLSQITVFKNHYSKGFEEPFILIKSVPVNDKTLITMGKNPEKPSIKIKVGEVNCIIFTSTQEEVEAIKAMKYIDIIGRANENEWLGEITYQIIISDYQKSVITARDLF